MDIETYRLNSNSFPLCCQIILVFFPILTSAYDALDLLKIILKFAWKYHVNHQVYQVSSISSIYHIKLDKSLAKQGNCLAFALVRSLYSTSFHICVVSHGKECLLLVKAASWQDCDSVTGDKPGIQEPDMSGSWMPGLSPVTESQSCQLAALTNSRHSFPWDTTQIWKDVE